MTLAQYRAELVAAAKAKPPVPLHVALRRDATMTSQ
jgi:hypothetical protein